MVYLDLSHMDGRLPGDASWAASSRSTGSSPVRSRPKTPMRIFPGVHYSMGGHLDDVRRRSPTMQGMELRRAELDDDQHPRPVRVRRGQLPVPRRHASRARTPCSRASSTACSAAMGVVNVRAATSTGRTGRGLDSRSVRGRGRTRRKPRSAAVADRRHAARRTPTSSASEMGEEMTAALDRGEDRSPHARGAWTSCTSSRIAYDPHAAVSDTGHVDEPEPLLRQGAAATC